MKRLFIVLAALVLTLGLCSIALAVGDGTGLVGSAHDFADGATARGGANATTPDSWNQSGERCRVCHVPHDHGLGTRYLSGLLWNRDVSTETYDMYNNTWSASIDNDQLAQPGGISKLCLGCHDGSVAIDRFDTYTGTDTMRTIYGGDLTALVIPAGSPGALDMRGTHPLSIRFDNTVDTNLHDPTNPMGTLGSGTIADVLDLDQRIQCSSCHDVHNQESAPGTNLLRVSNTSPTPSGLCLTCHIK